MSRRRKHETEAQRGERQRRRLRAAEKRHDGGKLARARIRGLYYSLTQWGGRGAFRAARLLIPRSWMRRLERGRPL